jgi:small subunit ribosomal protein S20
MANTAQARKRARQSEKRRQHNASLRSAFRSAIRKVRKAIDAGDQAGATRLLGEASGAIDRIADKKVIHKNTAARNKSRLAARIKALGQSAAKAPA